MLLSEFLTKHNAFWRWDGHKHVAQLTSGKLSDFFANCTPVYTDPRMQAEFAEDLVGCVAEELNKFAGKSPNIWVVGSAMGAIGLAQDVAAVEGFRSAYTEPGQGSGEMLLKRFDLGSEPHIVLVEDVVTTGGTTVRTINGILQKHPEACFFPKVLALVNRNPGVVIHPSERLEVRALYEHKAKVWDSADDLPEEMAGCTPLRPKGNWEALTTEKM